MPQKTQIHSIFEANKPDQATMEEFRTLGKAKHDGTITAEQQERLTALHTQQMEKMKAVHSQIIAILTPDQVTKMEQRKQEMMQKRQERKAAASRTRQLQRINLQFNNCRVQPRGRKKGVGINPRLSCQNPLR